MSVTNGFLRLSRDEFASLQTDAVAFEQRCEDDDGPDYLEMDKAGYELLFILDPSSVDYDNPDAKSTVPAVAAVLGGGSEVHGSIDLGYGPAMLIDDESLKASVAEFKTLDFDVCYQMASGELLAEVLMIAMDEPTFREYHWPYLQSLSKFVSEAVDRDMVVLRY